MVAFGHTAVGASVGLLSYQAFGQNNPIVGLFGAGTLGVISHYVTDFIPHGHFMKTKDFQQKIFWVILFDLLLSIIIFSYSGFASSGISLKLFYILFGIGGAQLPDVLDGLIYIKVLPRKGFFKIENNFHQWLHWHGKGENALTIGLRDTWQLLAILLSLYLILGH